MRTFALFGAKSFGFFEIYDVSAQTRGFEPVQTSFGQGEGSILCGRRLRTTTSNINKGYI